MARSDEPKRNQLARVEKTLADVLLNPSHGEISKALKGVDIPKQAKIRKEMTDLAYSIESLRRQWVEADEADRPRIEALGRARSEELAVVQAQVLPTLAELRDRDLSAGHDGHLPVSLLEVLICDLADFFNVGKNITEQQILASAHLILETYPNHTIEQVAMCFNRVKKGLYGEVYDRIDGGTIMRWLGKHTEEMRAQIQEENLRQHASQRPGTVRDGFYRIRDLKPTNLNTNQGDMPPTIGDIIDES